MYRLCEERSDEAIYKPLTPGNEIATLRVTSDRKEGVAVLKEMPVGCNDGIFKIVEIA